MREGKEVKAWAVGGAGRTWNGAQVRYRLFNILDLNIGETNDFKRHSRDRLLSLTYNETAWIFAADDGDC